MPESGFIASTMKDMGNTLITLDATFQVFRFHIYRVESTAVQVWSTIYMMGDYTHSDYMALDISFVQIHDV